MMDYDSTYLVRQNSDIAYVDILAKDGSKIYIRNGGVDGLFYIELSDYVPTGYVWLMQGHLDGKFTVPGIAEQIELDGNYYFYGNSDTDDVRIVPADKTDEQELNRLRK